MTFKLQYYNTCFPSCSFVCSDRLQQQLPVRTFSSFLSLLFFRSFLAGLFHLHALEATRASAVSRIAEQGTPAYPWHGALFTLRKSAVTPRVFSEWPPLLPSPSVGSRGETWRPCSLLFCKRAENCHLELQ